MRVHVKAVVRSINGTSGYGCVFLLLVFVTPSLYRHFHVVIVTKIRFPLGMR